jgi:adenosylhomocysteine nucleosidase
MVLTRTSFQLPQFAFIKMSILVCFALKEEAAAFRKFAAGKSGFTVLIVGMGRSNAERSIREFLTTSSPALVLTCGFAGGLDSSLKVGDVLFEVPDRKKQSQIQPRGGEIEPAVETALLAAGAKPAKFYCADRVAVTVVEKTKLRTETGADAVEMESAAVHKICRERGIPSVTVRVISDTADENLPLDFNALSKPDKSLDYRKLAWTIARSPRKIGALLQLQKKTDYAARQLAAVLEKVVLSQPR